MGLWDKVTNAGKTIKNTVQDAGEFVYDKAEDAGEFVYDNGGKEVGDVVYDIGESAVDFVSTPVDFAIDTGDALFNSDSINEGLRKFGSAATSFAATPLDGLIDGVNSVFRTDLRNVSEFADDKIWKTDDSDNWRNVSDHLFDSGGESNPDTESGSEGETDYRSEVDDKIDDLFNDEDGAFNDVVSNIESTQDAVDQSNYTVQYGDDGRAILVDPDGNVKRDYSEEYKYLDDAIAGIDRINELETPTNPIGGDDWNDVSDDITDIQADADTYRTAIDNIDFTSPDRQLSDYDRYDDITTDMDDAAENIGVTEADRLAAQKATAERMNFETVEDMENTIGALLESVSGGISGQEGFSDDEWDARQDLIASETNMMREEKENMYNRWGAGVNTMQYLAEADESIRNIANTRIQAEAQLYQEDWDRKMAEADQNQNVYQSMVQNRIASESEYLQGVRADRVQTFQAYSQSMSLLIQEMEADNAADQISLEYKRGELQGAIGNLNSLQTDMAGVNALLKSNDQRLTGYQTDVDNYDNQVRAIATTIDANYKALNASLGISEAAITQAEQLFQDKMRGPMQKLMLSMQDFQMNQVELNNYMDMHGMDQALEIAGMQADATRYAARKQANATMISGGLQALGTVASIFF